MKRKIMLSILVGALTIGSMSACGSPSQSATKSDQPAAAGTEVAKTDTRCDEGRAYLYGTDGKTVDFEAAYNSFTKALEDGSTEANFYLGILCDRFGYPEEDYAKAKSYYEAAGDNPYAKIALGFLYYNGDGVEVDDAKAKELFDAAIAAGCVEGYYGSAAIAARDKQYEDVLEYCQKAIEGQEQIYVRNSMRIIGGLYRYGNGVKQDYKKAMEWYTKAADLGDRVSMDSIASIYHSGDGVKQDYGKAMEWYLKAADLGYTDSIRSIGGLYESGAGVERDYVKAIEWYTKAVDLGNDPISMRYIAFLYKTGGYGVEQDYAKAMEWYMKASDSGSVSAMTSIAEMYETGEGVEQDYAKAMEWYMKAVDVDGACATYIGDMYKDGKGVERDYAKAMEWYMKAVDSGSAYAMALVGDMYKLGYGVAQDDAKAKEWYDKSEAAGYTLLDLHLQYLNEGSTE